MIYKYHSDIYFDQQWLIHIWPESIFWTYTSKYYKVPQGLSRKTLPATQKTWVWSLGQEDTLEEEMATHSSILAWKTPWTENVEVYNPQDHKELDMIEHNYKVTLFCSNLGSYMY